jgi:heat shock protein HtpX
MVLTFVLLAALYVFFAGALLYMGTGTAIVVLFFATIPLIQYFVSDRLALRGMGARKVDEDEAPELHRMVSRLSQQADLPTPTVAIADTATPNAFATGRNQRNATVCVTTGLMNTLDQEELEGVVAHELAHVKHRDMMVMTIASFLSTVAFLIVRFGIYFVGGRRNSGGFLVAIVVSLIVWIVSYFLTRALSRYREYSADRGAAQITGNPGALASALLRISGKMDEMPERDLRDQEEMNAFFIIPISKGIISKLFSTHPSTEKRVERLQEMERELAGV